LSLATLLRLENASCAAVSTPVCDDANAEALAHADHAQTIDMPTGSELSGRTMVDLSTLVENCCR
jgi:hypothetical protein